MTECCCDDIIIEVNEEGIDGVGIASIELVSTVGITKNYHINLTNGTHFDYSISDGSSIASISKTSSAGLVDTYTVTLTSGDTTTFEVTNGNGIASIVKTSTDNLTDTYTISYTNGTTSTFSVTNGNSIASVSKVSTQVLTDTYQITYTDEDKSPDSFTVVNGRGIASIAKTSTSGLVDTYTVTYNDNSTSTFTVTNGEKGDTGDTGNGIASITLLSESGLVKTYRITMTDGTHFDFDVTDGEKGDTGETGATGNGIASVEKTATVGLVDTYTITMTDGTTTTFDVTNGSDEWGALVGNLSDQTDLQTALDSKAPAITETASGSIASFSDGSASPVTALTVGIEPFQAGNGDPSPDNIRPITGWTGANIYRSGKNLWSNDYFATEENPMTLITDPTDPDYGYYNGRMSAWDANYDFANGGNGFLGERVLGVVTTSFTAKIKDGSSSTSITYRIFYKYSDGTVAFGNNISIGTTPARYYRTSNPQKICTGVCITSTAGATTANQCIKDVQIEFGDRMTDYEEPARTTLPISWQTEAGTVYGGSLDVTTGMLTVEWERIDMGTLNFTVYGSRFDSKNLNLYTKESDILSVISEIYKGITNCTGSSFNSDARDYIICFNSVGANSYLMLKDSRFTSADLLNTSLSGVYCILKLKTPVTVPLTPSQMQTLLSPSQMQTLLGENHIWADTGDVNVTYRADTKLFIQESLQSQSNALKLMLTPNVETEMVASQNYTSGSIVIVNNDFLKLTSAVASGANLVIGSNCVKTTMAEWVASLTA